MRDIGKGVVMLCGALSLFTLAACGSKSEPRDASEVPLTATDEAAPGPEKPKPIQPRGLIGTWKEVGALPLAIERPAAVLLKDGRVFAYGSGEDSRGALFEPKTGLWTATAPSKRPRGESGLSLLEDGQVMVSGGVHIPKGHYVMRSSERYDPMRDVWTDSGSTGTQRRGHTQHTLADGSILVIGGVGGGFARPTKQIDRYDPKSKTWSTLGALQLGRSFHASVVLGTGQLLVAGGQGAEEALKSFERCDVKAGTCRSMMRPSARDRPTMSILKTGDVLLVGGQSSRATSADAQLFDPSKGTFTPVGQPQARRNGHTATVLRDGRVLLVGGEKSAAKSSEVYDPEAKAWAKGPALRHPRHGHATIVLRDGSALLIGGVGPQGKPVLMSERLRL